jgi:hypothetical protein
LRKRRKSLANNRHRRHPAERRPRPLPPNNLLLRDNPLRACRVSLPRNRQEFRANRLRVECRVYLRQERQVYRLRDQA